MKAKLHDSSITLYVPVGIYHSRRSKSLDTLRDTNSGNRFSSYLDTKYLHKIELKDE